MSDPQDKLANDKDFLMWVRNRLVNLFGDSPDADWIKRLEDWSCYLPGPTLIPVTTRDVCTDYMRLPLWRAQDTGDYYLILKTDLETMRQYRPYEKDPELAERRAALNIRRRESGELF